MPHVNQIGLFAAICKHLEEKQGIKTLIPRHINAIIDGCNCIVDALAREEVHAAPNCGLAMWLASDDTGASSLFMARTLAPILRLTAPYHEYAYPYDPSDLWRCIGLLKSCPPLCEHLPEMAKTGPEWERLIGRWGELEALIEAEFTTGNMPKTYDLMKQILQ